LFLLAFLPDSAIVMVYEININTGEATAIGATGPNGTGNAFSFEDDGQLWMVQNTGVETLYELNPADGGVIGGTQRDRPTSHSTTGAGGQDRTTWHCSTRRVPR